MFKPSYWHHLSFFEKCIEVILSCLVSFAYVVGALTIGLVGYIIIALALDLHPQPEPEVAVVQKSKAEQFASELAKELGKKDVSVKIIVTRD